MKKFKKIRQTGALKRLEDQLLCGKKTAKGTGYVKVALTTKDIQRIEKEIQTLKHLS